MLEIVRNPESDVASQCIILQKQIANPNFSLRRFIINLGSYITNLIRQNQLVVGSEKLFTGLKQLLPSEETSVPALA